MVRARLPQLSTAMTVLVAVVFLLVLADLGFAAALATRNVSVQLAPAAASRKAGGQQKAAHPCNHGYYVSRAAHLKKGGQYTSGIAQSDLGKDGNCSAPLPAQPPAKKKGSGS